MSLNQTSQNDVAHNTGSFAPRNYTAVVPVPGVAEAKLKVLAATNEQILVSL